MNLLRVVESLCTHDGKLITSSLKKARSLLPKDSRRLNRIKDITQHLPRNHECGIFVEEILNSVSVEIQSAARRYLVRRKMQQTGKASLCFSRPPADAASSPSGGCETILEEMEDGSIRVSTDIENEMFILAQIYELAQASADAGNSTSTCLSQYSKKVMRASRAESSTHCISSE